MTIWTYTNGEDGPRWSADGVAVDLLTDGTFRVEGLTDVYDTLAQAKDRAERWRGVLAGAIAGNVKGQAEVLAQTAKMSFSLQYMLDDPLAVIYFPGPPPAIKVGDKVRSKNTGTVWTVSRYDEINGAVELKTGVSEMFTDDQTVRKNFEPLPHMPPAYPEAEWHGGR